MPNIELTKMETTETYVFNHLCQDSDRRFCHLVIQLVKGKVVAPRYGYQGRWVVVSPDTDNGGAPVEFCPWCGEQMVSVEDVVIPAIMSLPRPEDGRVNIDSGPLLRLTGG